MDTPMEPREVREARRLIAVADYCQPWDHRITIQFHNKDEGEAVCENGCGMVFTYVYKYTKEL